MTATVTDTGYAAVVQAHAARAARLYGPKMDEIARRAGFELRPDGSNDARTKEDVVRYLEALKAVVGQVAVTSARLTMQQAARSRGLDASF